MGLSSDLELIGAINEGDEKAFGDLYMRYKDWVVATAMRYTNDREAALDVLQETFVYFLKKFPGFELRSQLKTFLYPAIKNISLSWLRQKRRYTEEELHEESLSAEEAEPVDEGCETIRRVLKQLPVAQSEVLWMRYVDDMPLQEIAAALEVPQGTVKSRMHLALKTLRNNPGTRLYFE